MSITLIDSDSTTDNLGISFRRHRTGPEQDLVSWFIDELPIRIPRGNHATIFCEPKIESGYPDLVIVIWNVSVAEKWSSARVELTTHDLRLLHYLHCAGPCEYKQLTFLSHRNLKLGLRRLEEARVIRHVNGKWKARPLSSLFAARHIVAVEAKVSKWNLAFEQALLNTWFASESYILIPRIPRGEKIRNIAQSLGFGIYSKTENLVDKPPRSQDNLPRSYVSWLFNELAWRASR